MRIGIFFGGPAREREISFAGGKTAFEHLDKSLFTPIPVFVDSFGRFIKLNPKWMYEKGIRDFYPAQSSPFSLYVESFPGLRQEQVPAEIGVLMNPEEFSAHFDFALLAMHGPDCEDGAIQGLLEWYRIPYSGPGMMGSAVGIDKILQNQMIAMVNHQQKKTEILSYSEWVSSDQAGVFKKIKDALGLPIVIKAPHQGSSIGVYIIKRDDQDDFINGVNQCFFQSEVASGVWQQLSGKEKEAFAQKTANLDEGVGYPVQFVEAGELIYHPLDLIRRLDLYFGERDGKATLLSSNAEDRILFEEFIEGQEFSCGCIQDENGDRLALPPTEIIKVSEVFDFNSKYKPGATRKRIPIETTLENNRKVQQYITDVAGGLGIDVCVRIDGFLTKDGEVLLHDPNTIPGMSPTSLIFKQMAEIGLNVTQTITYFIRQSVRQRMSTGKDTVYLRRVLEKLDSRIQEEKQRVRPEEVRVVEATDEAFGEARQWWSRLNAEAQYTPVVVLYLEGVNYRLTVPSMFKDYVEDVVTLLKGSSNILLEETRKKASKVTEFYGGSTNFEITPVAAGEWTSQ